MLLETAARTKAPSLASASALPCSRGLGLSLVCCTLADGRCKCPRRIIMAIKKYLHRIVLSGRRKESSLPTTRRTTNRTKTRSAIVGIPSFLTNVVVGQACVCFRGHRVYVFLLALLLTHRFRLSLTTLDHSKPLRDPAVVGEEDRVETKLMRVF